MLLMTRGLVLAFYFFGLLGRVRCFGALDVLDFALFGSGLEMMRSHHHAF